MVKLIYLKNAFLALPLVVGVASGCILPAGVTGSNAIQPGLLVDFMDTSNKVSNTVCPPLRSADIRAIVVDGVVEVTMVQEFETACTGTACTWPDTKRTQSRYQLPLDEKAAVTAFRAEVGGRVIEGIVKDKETAQKEFDDAVDAGKPAFLAKQTRADIFEISCGNMPPNSIVTVTLKYVAPLEVLDGKTYRFVLPTKIAARYEPRTEVAPIPNLEPLLYSGVTVSIGTLMSTETTALSGTHALQISAITKRISAIVVTDKNPLARDVVIDFTPANLSFDPQIFVEKSDSGTYAMMLSWVAAASNAAGVVNDGSDKEFIFILDRSGSMSDKIVQLRKAMRIILDELHPDARFNLIGFGGTFAYLFADGSKLVSNQNAYARAVTYIDSFNADLGGTEMLAPIKAVLTSSPISTHQRIIFLITDGQVSNDAEVINFVGDNLGSSRVFTLGLGASAGRTLLNGIARNGAGTSDYVNGDKDADIVEAATRQIVTASGTPSISITNMKFGGVSATLTPFQRAPTYAGRRFLQYFLTDGTIAPGIFTLTVNSSSKSEVTTYQPGTFIQANAVLETDIIHKLAAREQIRDLEEKRSPLHANGAVRLASTVKAEIVRIGVKYQIISTETSFVAIDNLGWTGLTKTTAPTPAPVKRPGLCFSAQNKVVELDKGIIAMKDVAIGDMVSIGKNQYSQVYGFGHRDVEHTAEYVTLHVKGQAPLEISEDHMLFIDKVGAVPASTVAVGDWVLLGNGGKSQVTKISLAHRAGAFAPFTESGTIVVSGIVASSYVSLQEGSGALVIGGIPIVSMQWIAHAYQAPRRIMCKMNLDICKNETYSSTSGISTWVEGPFLVSKWLLRQPTIVACILSLVAIFVAILLSGMEMIFMNGVILGAVVVGLVVILRETTKKPAAKRSTTTD
jgi:Vault protein inter-alpha-trypsin domain/Hint module/von Willebrand factor type A domain